MHKLLNTAELCGAKTRVVAMTSTKRETAKAIQNSETKKNFGWSVFTQMQEHLIYLSFRQERVRGKHSVGKRTDARTCKNQCLTVLFRVVDEIKVNKASEPESSQTAKRRLAMVQTHAPKMNQPNFLVLLLHIDTVCV